MTILKKVNGKKLSFNHEVKVSRKMAKMLAVEAITPLRPS